jgi:hypothetical protein
MELCGVKDLALSVLQGLLGEILRYAANDISPDVVFDRTENALFRGAQDEDVRDLGAV